MLKDPRGIQRRRSKKLDRLSLLPCTFKEDKMLARTTVMRAILTAAAVAAPAFAREGGSRAVHRSLAFMGAGAVPTLRQAQRASTRLASVSMNAGAAADLEKMVQDKIKGNKVMIFSKSTCPFCSKAKKAMDGLDMKYEVMELDKREDGQAIQDIMLGMTGGRSVPRVFINGEFIGGGDDTVAKASSGELLKLYNA